MIPGRRPVAAAGPPVTREQLGECQSCGQFQRVPALAANMRANCVRCGSVLRATRADPLGHHLALTFASLVLFAIVWLGMLMKVSAFGIVHETTLDSGPAELVARGLWPLALAVAFTTAFASLIKFLGTIYVLIGLRLQRPPPNMRGVFRLARKVGAWSMLEVLLLGVFVAYTKLGDLVSIELGPAVYALGALTVVLVWAELALDPQAVWEAIARRGQTHAPLPPELPPDSPVERRAGAVGCETCALVSVPAETGGRCPRCGAGLHARKPDGLARTWAFVVAAAVLYVPANIYPVLTVIQLGAGAPSTILGGVEELLASGLYPLALLVFFASILVPMFKLIGLAFMLGSVQVTTPEKGGRFLLLQRTKLYHAVAWIGRWSMVDIYMESLLGALVQFGQAVTIEPGFGAVAFCAVVFLTIFAADSFDPRLMWDAAGLNAHRPVPSRRAVPRTGTAPALQP